MKHVKLLLILSFTVILLFPLAAQKQFHYGLRVGGNMSTFWGIGGKDIQPKLGYNAGITADIDFDKNMYLLSGLFLFDRGGKYADNHPDAARRGQTIDLLYLRVPVHVAYKYYINPDLKQFFSIGPYVAWGIYGKDALDRNAFDNNYRNLDVGLGASTGLEYNIYILRLGVDVGLMDVTRTTPVQAQQDRKNFTLYLTGGIKI